MNTSSCKIIVKKYAKDLSADYLEGDIDQVIANLNFLREQVKSDILYGTVSFEVERKKNTDYPYGDYYKITVFHNRHETTSEYWDRQKEIKKQIEQDNILAQQKNT